MRIIIIYDYEIDNLHLRLALDDPSLRLSMIIRKLNQL